MADGEVISRPLRQALQKEALLHELHARELVDAAREMEQAGMHGFASSLHRMADESRTKAATLMARLRASEPNRRETDVTSVDHQASS